MEVALGRKKKGLPSVPEPEPPKPVPQWRVVAGNLASGAIAGCTVEAALYPLDTIKTRLQMMRTGGGVRALLKGGGGKALYAGIGCATFELCFLGQRAKQCHALWHTHRTGKAARSPQCW